MSKIDIPGRWRRDVIAAIARVDGMIGMTNQQLGEALGSGFPQPRPISEIADKLTGLRDAMAQGSKIDSDLTLPEWFAGILKTVLLIERRAVAADVATRRRRAADASTIGALQARLEPFEFFATQPWFAQTKALRVPGVREFLAAEYVAAQGIHSSAQPHLVAYDPKTGILLSESQFRADFPPLRVECDARRVGLSLLFLDVDDFKALNSLHGEPKVDRDVLPLLMRVLDAGFFGRGRCYRHGGDEFVALVPNAPRSVLTPITKELMATLADTEYPGIPERPTLSIGICTLEPGSALTEDEALELAAKAKKVAKDAGKGRVFGVLVHELDVPEPEEWSA